MNIQTRNNLSGIFIGAVLTLLSYAFGAAIGVVTEVSYIELFAVFTSYWSTYLCVVQSRWNYPIGVVTTISYAVLFYQWGLYASMITNIYLPIALLYGYFRWGPDGNTRKVTYTNPIQWITIYIPLVFGSVLLVSIVLHLANATLSNTDAAILVLTVLAQWLLDNKKLETWFVWALVNVFAIYTYTSTGLYIAAIQYVFFLANTVWGYLAWKRTMGRVVASFSTV